MTGTVHIVHCVDTEGPLHESLEATFERLEEIFGLHLEPSMGNLSRLQAGQIDLGGLEDTVRRVLDPHLLAYNDDWAKIDCMLADCMSSDFRNRFRDSEGDGWVYNWFCVDHVDYTANPRRRDIGYHHVFDHYQHASEAPDSQHDGLHFHYHPHNFRREAHRSATHWWASSDSLYQILSRRVIDRLWFPAAHRPGFHAIRPDSHWFLEQFIPFDYSNQSMASTEGAAAQSGTSGARWGDWRRAPATWVPYHPAHDDYQCLGDCRRWVARCLNVGTRFRLLCERDVRQAFEEAREEKPVVLSFADHDHRDIRPDVDSVYAMVTSVAADYPGVAFRFCEAIEAMRSALRLPFLPACEFDLRLESIDTGGHVMYVRTDSPTFGPQPWLALKTSAGTYHHDNFDIDVPHHRWEYVFDDNTFPIGDLEAVGVAGANAFGISTAAVLDVRTGKVRKKLWNG